MSGKPHNEDDYIVAGGLEITARANALSAVINEGHFNESYWICDKEHKFAKGQVNSPHGCPECRSHMIRWVPV